MQQEISIIDMLTWLRDNRVSNFKCKDFEVMFYPSTDIFDDPVKEDAKPTEVEKAAALLMRKVDR